LAEGEGGLAQLLLLQPGSGPAPDPTAAVTALMGRPAMLVNAIPAIPAIPATPAVTLPARDPDVVHEMTLAAGTPSTTVAFILILSVCLRW